MILLFIFYIYVFIAFFYLITFHFRKTMPSIPTKSRKPVNPPGPGQYNVDQQNTQMQYSVSQKGSASFSSGVDRFPFIHDKWGYPESSLYNHQDSFLKMQAHKGGSAIPDGTQAFKTTSRDNFFYQAPITATPDPGNYEVDRSAAFRLAQIRNQRRAYEKAKRMSPIQKLMAEAAAQKKSIARYIIESDPNYVHPPPPFGSESLPQRPVGTEYQYSKNIGYRKDNPAKINITEVNKLQQKYNLEKTQGSTYLAQDIQNEIEKAQGSSSPKRDQQEPYKFIEEVVDKKFYPKALNIQPLDEEGISFNTRITAKAQDCLQVLEEQRERLRYVAPNSYSVKMDILKTNHGYVPIGKQLGREQKIPNKNPGVGTYEVQLPPTKQSFHVNEDNKFVL